MEGGKSPPPKLKEDNLQKGTQGSVPDHPTKWKKLEGWGDMEKDEQEETLSSLFDEVNAGKFVAEKKKV